MLLADILADDPDFLLKLPRYKTAYSITYQTHVGIDHVIMKQGYDPIIVARVAFTNNLYHFRVEELTDFCL